MRMTTRIMSALISGLVDTRVRAAFVIAYSPCMLLPGLSNRWAPLSRRLPTRTASCSQGPGPGRGLAPLFVEVV